jgi:transposase
MKLAMARILELREFISLTSEERGGSVNYKSIEETLLIQEMKEILESEDLEQE